MLKGKSTTRSVREQTGVSHMGEASRANPALTGEHENDERDN
jgi:hypothetical protein